MTTKMAGGNKGRTWVGIGLWVALVALCVMLVPHDAFGMHLPVLGSHAINIGPMLLAGAISMEAVPKTYDQLAKQSSPQTTGQPEAVCWCYFDQVDQATAVAANLNFFSTVRGDKTLGNIEQPNSITDPYFYEIVGFTCDFQAIPTATATGATTSTGTLTDIVQIQNIGRALFQFSINSKLYLQVPLKSMPPMGGAVGLLSAYGTAAAGLDQYANGGMPGNMLRVNKSITLPPRGTFTAQVSFGAAPTLTNTIPIQIGMWGILHRRVL